jgi:hypothetical protein
MSILDGKKVIVIGDRDGNTGPLPLRFVRNQPVPRSFSPPRSALSEPPQVQWIWRIRSE